MPRSWWIATIKRHGYRAGGIARRFHVVVTHVYNKVHREGLKFWPMLRYHTDDEIRLVLWSSFTLQQAANRLRRNTDANDLLQILRKRGIEHDFGHHPGKRNLTGIRLDVWHRLFIESNRNASHMAKRLRIHRHTILAEMKRRKLKWTRLGKNKLPWDGQQLDYMANTLRLSDREIGILMGCTARAVWQARIRYKIPLRHPPMTFAQMNRKAAKARYGTPDPLPPLPRRAPSDTAMSCTPLWVQDHQWKGLPIEEFPETSPDTSCRYAFALQRAVGSPHPSGMPPTPGRVRTTRREGLS